VSSRSTQGNSGLRIVDEADVGERHLGKLGHLVPID
jgi:hypothetical protein